MAKRIQITPTPDPAPSNGDRPININIDKDLLDRLTQDNPQPNPNPMPNPPAPPTPDPTPTPPAPPVIDPALEALKIELQKKEESLRNTMIESLKAEGLLTEEDKEKNELIKTFTFEQLVSFSTMLRNANPPSHKRTVGGQHNKSDAGNDDKANKEFIEMWRNKGREDMARVKRFV
jgi:type IV secretory pathway VirB10-like protein